MSNPNAQLAWDRAAETLLADDPMVDPLRIHDCPPITDGACAVILASGDRARELRDRPAWIRDIDHQNKPIALGVRDLPRSVSPRLPRANAAQGGARPQAAGAHRPPP